MDRPILPAAAYERAREIAASAPPASDAKRARLQMLCWGSPVETPAAASLTPAQDAA
jgi:hypothetical protein